jgi:hypothetical protein
MLFLMRELHFVTVAEFRCLYVMVHKIKYTLVADIVDYFKEIRTLSGPIEGTSLVTRIALNLGCEEMANVPYIARDVPIPGLSHFMHAHILREEPDHSISMLYEGGSKVLWLPNPVLVLHSCEQLTLRLGRMGDACHSYIGPPWTRGRAYLEVTRQTPPQPQWDTGYGSGIPVY